MFKLFKITLATVVICVSVSSAATTENFELSVPEFIPQGKSFEVSLITSKEFPEADNLELYIIPENELIINNAELRIGDTKISLGISQAYLKEFSTSSLRINIDLNDSLIASTGTYFQLLLNFKPEMVSKTSFGFYGIFKKNKEPIGYLESDNKTFVTDNEHLYNVELHFYKTYDIAGKTALFNPYSDLKIPFPKNDYKKLLFEFWMKQLDYKGKFINIINSQTNLPEYKLEINENQMLSSSSDVNRQLSFEPLFVSTNTWYHISLLFSVDESKAYFYCNGKEFSNIEYPQYNSFKDLSIKFLNLPTGQSAENRTSTFCIDQIRLINLTGSYQTISRNKNFLQFSSDSSRVLLQIDFSDSQLDNFVQSSKLSYNNIKLIQSDAPIFPRAPELNLKVMNKYYEIEWSGGDYSNTAYYVLERAVGTSDFTEIGKWDAERNIKKNYSQLSEKIEQDIVYFRVKQINLDGTEICSEVVKVGQGILEDVLVDQNYPNPFNPKTSIEIELLQDNEVVVAVFDLAGKEVAVLHRGYLTQGIYKFEFDGSELPSGVYLYRVSTPQFTQTRKMILTK